MFTRQQIIEIQKKLEALGKKDSQFPYVENVTDGIEIPVLQDMQNKRLVLARLSEYLTGGLIPAIEETIKELLGNLTPEDISDELRQIVDSLDALKSQLSQVVTDLQNLLTGSEEKILQALNDCCNKMQQAMDLLDSKVDGISSGVDSLSEKIDTVDSKVTELSSAVTEGFTALESDLDNIKVWMEGQFESVSIKIDSGVDNLTTLIESLRDSMNSQFSAVTTGLDTLRATVNQYQTSMSNRIDVLEEQISGQFTALRSWILQQLDNLQGTLREMFNNFRDEFFNEMNNRFTTLRNQIQTALDNLANRMDTAMSNLITEIQSLDLHIQNSLNRIEAGFDDLNRAMADLENSVARDLDSIKTAVQSIDQQIRNIEGSIDNVNDSIDNVNNSLATVNNSILELSMRLKDGLSDLQTDISNMYSELKESFDSLKEEVADQWNKNVTLTVECNTEGAKVFLNNLERTYITVLSGTDIVLHIEAEGYEPYDEIFPLWRDQHMVINLTEPSTPDYYATLTVTCVPDEAEIRIGGEVRQVITVPIGTELHVTATLDRYNPYDEYITVTDFSQLLEIVLTEATESEILSLRIEKADNSPVDPADAPMEGGTILLKGIATVLYTNGQQEEKDVTNRIEWSISGAEGGLVNNGNGEFFLQINTGRLPDSYTVTGKVTPDSTATMLKYITI